MILRAFSCFVNWMYKDRLSRDREWPGEMVPVYILADMLMCPDLKNAAVETLHDVDEDIDLKDLTSLAEAGYTECKMMDFLLSMVATW